MSGSYFIYNIFFIPALRLVKSIYKLFNKKLAERETEIPESLKSLTKLNKSAKRVWFHAASMGEFEQAKPIIELIKENEPDILIICSFFSPSGYKNQKNYKYADAVVYLPFDTKVNATHFIDLVKPNQAIFVRYEIWFNYLFELKKRSIPAFLICATMPGSSVLKKFPFVRSFYNSLFNLFKTIYTVGQVHTEHFINSGCKSEVITLTDTRFDRIIKNVENAASNPVIPKELFDGEFVLVAGSSWSPDEDLILEGLRKLYQKKYRIRLIIVPHEPTEVHLNELNKKISNRIFLSELLQLLENKDTITNIKNKIDNKVIIVDSIGKLLKLYSVADAAYIGGAFGAGVHSVTEPAGYGVPLATGPGMTNSPDAVQLNKLGALTILKTAEDFFEWIDELLTNEVAKNKAGSEAKKYVFDSNGSSQIIYHNIMKSL